MTQDLDEAGKGRALEARHAAMVDHDSGEGVRFGSGAWLVTACRSAP